MSSGAIHTAGVPCPVEPNSDQVACSGCDQVDVFVYFTPMGGPFCRECLEALCDPDQALLLEERLARYEAGGAR